MPLGFTAISTIADIEIQLHTPAIEKHFPLITFSQQGAYVALLMGCLHYQHAILAQLEASCPTALYRECSTHAATLALSAYRALGPSSLETLEGDFALVIWDAERLHFVAMRDPLGGYPLFWREYAGKLALSTSLWSLLTLGPQTSLNEEYFADFLMMPLPRQEGVSEICAYREIQRVLPGSIVTLRSDPFKVEKRVYWDWLTHIHDPGTDDVTELADQYKPLLSTAVRERLRGRTLSHCSGGMDSTTISLIAQDEMRSGAGEAPLHTFSLIYSRLPVLARERSFIEEALRCQQNIVAHCLVADDLLDFGSFLDPPPHEEPYASLWSLGKDKVALDVASQIGARSVLTGLGADEIHDIHPFYLTDLLLKGHLWNAWQEACTWAKVYNCSSWVMLQSFGLAALAPVWLLSKARRYLYRQSAVTLRQQTDWTVPPWIRPDFVRRYSLWDRASEHVHQMYRRCQGTDLSMTVHAVESRAGDVLRWSVAAPLDIAIAHPFLDQRLISFGLGMHLRFQPEPGKMKPVLAEAMRGILPEAIRKRRRKGHFNEVYYLGLSHHLCYLEMMVQQMPPDGLDMFDKEILLKNLQEASIASANIRQLQRMNATLAMMLWLSRQREWIQRATGLSQVIHVQQKEEGISPK